MRIRELIENTGEWISHRQLAEIIYMRTGNKQLARDFDAIEDDFWEAAALWFPALPELIDTVDVLGGILHAAQQPVTDIINPLI